MQSPLDLVMLVDDNETDNFISKRIIELTKFAAAVEVCDSGKRALKYLEAHAQQPEKLPTLILLDINMPVVDGFIFMYEFDMLPETIKRKCKVAVLSSSDNQRDIDRMIGNEYVIEFIKKPLTQPILETLSSRLAAHQGSSSR
ncbi:MAG: response regulator [Bernardetiaceae bacterium]